MYKRIIRPILFLFDPESVHHFTFKFIRFTSAIPGVKSIRRSSNKVSDPHLKRTVFGLEFDNPVGIAAGFDKNAVLLNHLDSFGFGFVEIGTVTPRPQGGNPRPRLFRLKKDQGIINRMGFNNNGVDAMVEKLKGFTGLPHRCQAIETRDGVRWINDSKATNVGATLAAIEGLANTLSSSNKLILIAGGDGKGADFSPLSAAINEHVDWLITLGKDGREIAKLKADSIFTRTMDEAVACARTKAEKGDLVLLSPACASLDMFKNFAARGEAFVNAVQAGQEAYI